MEEAFIARRVSADTNLTRRGSIVGLLIGVIVCFSNTYFSLQTGGVWRMTTGATEIGFAFFKTVARGAHRSFTPVKNVLVQTVAGAFGTLPLGLGCVGVIPASSGHLTTGPCCWHPGALVL